MENSAKALLIAGSILLFILLSTFAMYVFSKTRSHTSDIYDLMLTNEVDNFNEKFLKFENRDLKIQDVVSIINLAKDYNRKEKLPVVVKVISDSGIIEETTETNLLSDTIDINKILEKNLDKIYKCSVSYGENSNLIENIKIEKKE